MAYIWGDLESDVGDEIQSQRNVVIWSHNSKILEIISEKIVRLKMIKLTAAIPSILVIMHSVEQSKIMDERSKRLTLRSRHLIWIKD